jgi:hypothetical protein
MSRMRGKPSRYLQPLLERTGILNAQIFSTLPLMYNAGLIASNADNSVDDYKQMGSEAQIQDENNLVGFVFV